MRDVSNDGSSSSQTKKCLHNTPQGLAWKRVIHTKKLLGGLVDYTVIEKQCQACGDTFLADLKGRRLLN